MKIKKGSVTFPVGFKASGIHCGIKRSGKPDLSLIYSQVPAVASGVFTKNSIKAAPVVVTRNKLHNHKAQAIITNSGNANCFTGSFGLLYAKRTAEVVAKLLNIHPSNVCVASTGIIGQPLPFKKIRKAVPRLVRSLNKKGNKNAAKGILTTDTKIKECAVQIKLNGSNVKIGAIAKGSGMIAPNMATMLCFITTDAAITAKMLKSALKQAVDQSFHCITIDNCMSTNDMVIVLANRLAKNKTIKHGGKDFQTFCKALNHVCLELAKMIVRDGEGATKFMEITVNGGKNIQQAKKTAFAIANSNLVKTSAYGSDPNWGRVAAAVGSLGMDTTEKQLKIKFCSFKKKDINITVDLNLGHAHATVYTSDLSLDYVRINGKYN